METYATPDPEIGRSAGEHATLTREEHRVRGDTLLAKVKELVHQGNVRRIIVKNDDGNTLIEAPLTVGVVGAVVAPVWAALGAIAALVTNCSIEVELAED